MFVDLRRRTVLLIGRAASFPASLVAELRTRRIRVFLVETVAEAREWISEHQPDALVMEAQLLDRDAVHLMQADVYRPIIFVCPPRDACRQHAGKLRGLGADDILPLPLDAGRFLDRLEVHLHYRGMLLQLQRRQEMLMRLAAYDELTKLFNRRSFTEAMTGALERSSATGEPVALLLIDVDHFKNINDNYGHQAGDEVLKGLAACLSSPLRQYDTLGRYGGEEFCVLLPDVDAPRATQVAERLRAAVAHGTFHAGRREVNITVSVGVAWVPGGSAVSVDDFFLCADVALYQAKRNGRNQIALRNMAESSCEGELSRLRPQHGTR